MIIIIVIIIMIIIVIMIIKITITMMMMIDKRVIFPPLLCIPNKSFNKAHTKL